MEQVLFTIFKIHSVIECTLKFADDTTQSGAADNIKRRGVILSDLNAWKVGPCEPNEFQQDQVQGFPLGSGQSQVCVHLWLRRYTILVRETQTAEHLGLNPCGLC